MFKAVTYEMLNDPKFGKAVRKALPDLKHLFNEFDAAPTAQAPSDANQNTGSKP